MGRILLQPSCVGGQCGRAGTEPAPGGLREDAEGLRQCWGGSERVQGGSHRMLGAQTGCRGTQTGVWVVYLNPRARLFVAWCDPCQILGSSHQQLYLDKG